MKGIMLINTPISTNTSRDKAEAESVVSPVKKLAVKNVPEVDHNPGIPASREVVDKNEENIFERIIGGPNTD